MISQITAAGVRPARSARSQPASVWPARTSTPPFCAMIGKMWPGWTMSAGLACFAVAARTVRARSAAEMPVVTPLAASIDTVNAVPMRRAVVAHHQRQVQLAAALLGEREADEAARVRGHEVDRLGRDEVGGQHEVALVLAVLLVHQHDHAAVAELVDDFGGGDDLHEASILPHFTPRSRST